jgi:hypothetical protein
VRLSNSSKEYTHSPVRPKETRDEVVPDRLACGLSHSAGGGVRMGACREARSDPAVEVFGWDEVLRKSDAQSVSNPRVKTIASMQKIMSVAAFRILPFCGVSTKLFKPK